MLILILIDVQYLQNAVFSFEKGSNRQNHFSSGSHHPVTYPRQQNFRFPPPLTLFGKSCYVHIYPLIKLDQMQSS